MNFAPKDKVQLRYFPNVNGVVDRIDEEGRIWVTLDTDVLDCEAGVSMPIAPHEMRSAYSFDGDFEDNVLLEFTKLKMEEPNKMSRVKKADDDSSKT